MQEENVQQPQSNEFQILTPKQIYDYLNEFVIGQQEAKKVLSVAIYNHYKRFLINVIGVEGQNTDETLEDVVIEKSNLMMLGNTGTGKTYMIKTAAKILGIPCYIADCTKLTESGFVGDDVESVLTGMLHAANGNVRAAENGICILDECDKLSRRGENPSLTRDVGGEGVQQGLLKIVEGTKVGVPPNGGRKHPEQQLIEMDTSNILFIGMGAFVGMEKIVEHRLNTTSIGFNTPQKINGESKENLLDKVTQDDLKKFGMIPELIGRFPVITHTNPLSVEDLIRILQEPQNSILKQYRKLLLFDNVNLTFSEDSLKLVAKVANSTNTGARGLRSILENILTEVMFEYGGNHDELINFEVTEEFARKTLNNKYNLEDIK